MSDPVGEIAAAVAAAAALATVVVSVRYGRTAGAQLEEAATAQRRVADLMSTVATETHSAGEAARETVELARAGRREDEDYRLAAERDRLRHRYETIGGLIEEIFWAAERRFPGFDGREFMEPRNRLAAAVVGLEQSLPLCFAATLSNSTEDAIGQAGAARGEIHAAIHNLH
jgi:hypothetical protein